MTLKLRLKRKYKLYGSYKVYIKKPLNHYSWSTRSVVVFVFINTLPIVPIFSYFLLEFLCLGRFWAAAFGQWVCRPS